MDTKNLRNFWRFLTFDLKYLSPNNLFVKAYRTKVVHIYKLNETYQGLEVSSFCL